MPAYACLPKEPLGSERTQTCFLVDLTEAPEDAVCSLVTDLLHYCEREKIDWTQEVLARAWKDFRSERMKPEIR